MFSLLKNDLNRMNRLDIKLRVHRFVHVVVVSQHDLTLPAGFRRVDIF